ncbi:hypothetical protein [Algihabitans albus]|uniref:hypothetical protein n=1 Tax=Algihabitans albus TaxID=2164067 RepID=UPI0013C31250|nr:hypothetical protein [Algihabitans albus]
MLFDQSPKSRIVLTAENRKSAECEAKELAVSLTLRHARVLGTLSQQIAEQSLDKSIAVAVEGVAIVKQMQTEKRKASGERRCFSLWRQAVFGSTCTAAFDKLA